MSNKGIKFLGIAFGGVFGLVCLFIVAVFAMIICGWVLIGCVLTKTAKAVNEDGAKKVIERVWEGPESEAGTDSEEEGGWSRER